MNRNDFKNTLRNLAAVERDLARLVRNAQKLAEGLGKDLGSVFDEAVRRRLEEANRLMVPLATILRLGTGTNASAATGGIRLGAGKRARRGRKSRGGRGRKLNLTPEQIKSALSQAGGVKTKAADILGVSIPTFNKYYRQG